MMDVIIMGAGGHGRDVLVALRGRNNHAQPIRFLGFIDDGNPDFDRIDRLEAPFLGNIEVLNRYEGVGFVIGVGNPQIRERLAARATAAGLVPVTIVHQDSTVGQDVILGPGSVLCPGARVTTNVRVGAHVHININSTVAHDVTIGDFATLNPQAAVSGDVTIAPGATIGAGAVIRQGVSIGAYASVGAGAVVIGDVLAHSVVAGVPARRLAPEQKSVE